MKNKLVLFLLVACASLLTHSAYAQVAVIANSSVKVASVSKAELSDVFTGTASSLKDGSRVTPVLLKSGVAHSEFLNEYVHKSDNAFRAGWRSLVFSGQGAMPKAFDSEAAIVEYVAATPGAIGYVSKTTAHDKVKTLSVR
jgi:ABC-type phosphate transport system substrate-binding protein